jgi:hypothetical protein
LLKVRHDLPMSLYLINIGHTQMLVSEELLKQMHKDMREYVDDMKRKEVEAQKDWGELRRLPKYWYPAQPIEDAVEAEKCAVMYFKLREYAQVRDEFMLASISGNFSPGMLLNFDV